MSSDLTEILVRLGLTNAEAQVFLAATRLGGGTNREIASAAAKERANTHHILSKLQQIGIIEPTLGSPTRFRPVDTKEAIDHLFSLQTTRLRELDDLRTKVAASLSTGGLKATQTTETYSIIKGRISTYLRMIESIEQCTDEVSILLSAHGLTRLRRFRNFVDTVKEKTKDGVRFRIISEINAGNVGDATAFSEICELRHIRGQSTNASIYDKRIGSVALTLNEALEEDVQEHVALWTNGPSFVSTLDHFFDSVWLVAASAKPTMRQIESETGPSSDEQ